MADEREFYVATDIEADGPIPGRFSMLSLGMAIVGEPELTFYTELKPISEECVPAALAISKLDREKLKTEAPHPRDAMRAMVDWVNSHSALGKPVFLAAPAVFDGMFVHWYLMEFVGRSPFAASGAGIDLRSYWMGMGRRLWRETSSERIQTELGIKAPPHTHNALDDARELAMIFERILKTREQ